MQAPIETKRAIAGFAIPLIAGVLVLAQGIVRLIRAEQSIEFSPGELRRRFFGEAVLTTLGIVAIVFAIIILLGAHLIYNPRKEVVGGRLVLVFSILSIFTGGGFLLGLILGTVEEALGLPKKMAPARRVYYHLILVFLTKMNLTRSLNISENAAEHDNTKRVSAKGMGSRPGIPNVVTAIAVVMLSIIAASRVLLGLESQK